MPRQKEKQNLYIVQYGEVIIMLHYLNRQTTKQSSSCYNDVSLWTQKLYHTFLHFV